SFVEQTYGRLEIHLVDDASTDGTVAIARRFEDRVTIHRNERNLGLRANWERCMHLGTGKYRALFHADDVYEPDMVAQQVAFLEGYPEVGLVFTSVWIIDDAGRTVGRSRSFRALGLADDDHALFSFPQLIRTILRHNNVFVTPSAMARALIHAD